MSQCKKVIREGPPCPRPAGADGLCVFHQDPATRDKEHFKSELWNHISSKSGTIIDLREITWGDTTDLLFKTYPLEVQFDNSVFLQTVSFQKSNFQGIASFKGVHFLSDANFRESQFHEFVNFEGAHFFGKTSLKGAHLSQEVSFDKIEVKKTGSLFIQECKISGARSEPFSFQGCKFHGKTLVELTIPINLGIIKFTGCDVLGLRISTLPEVFQTTVFENCTWPRVKHFWYFPGRLTCADERESEVNFRTLNLYKRLQSYYYDRAEYETANEFYVSFMVAKRKVMRKGLWAKAIDIFYSTVSRYGLSINRPLTMLSGTILLIPAILLTLGIRLEANGPLVYKGLLEDHRFLLFTSEYWQTLILSLSLSTLFRSSPLAPPLTSIQHALIFFQTLLITLGGAFLAIGVKRHFSPRKPISDK